LQNLVLIKVQSAPLTNPIIPIYGNLMQIYSIDSIVLRGQRFLVWGAFPNYVSLFILASFRVFLDPGVFPKNREDDRESPLQFYGLPF
jgi:hypothetical protein